MARRRRLRRPARGRRYYGLATAVFVLALLAKPTAVVLPLIVWLVAAGGLAYTVGAVVYGTRRPNPSPRWFGFHEVFHSLTVIGFVCHYIAVSIAVYHA